MEKLKQINDNKNMWDNWSLEEKKQLLDIYFIISQKETNIFNLIWEYHGCDSWEDIFRDYNERYLEDKTVGVEIALDAITEEINKEK